MEQNKITHTDKIQIITARFDQIDDLFVSSTIDIDAISRNTNMTNKLN